MENTPPEIIEPVKPESMFSTEEKRLLSRCSQLEETLKQDAGIMKTLSDKITKLEGELEEVRKSTLYNFSVFMQSNWIWIGGLFSTVCITIATVYKIITLVI